MPVELNHTIVPADPGCRQPGRVYGGKNGGRGTYFRDRDGHLMEILTPLPGEPA